MYYLLYHERMFWSTGSIEKEIRGTRETVMYHMKDV